MKKSQVYTMNKQVHSKKSLDGQYQTEINFTGSKTKTGLFLKKRTSKDQGKYEKTNRNEQPKANRVNTQSSAKLPKSKPMTNRTKSVKKQKFRSE